MIYKLKSGRYVRTEDMLKAYEIVFGEPASIDSPKYLDWLWKRLHFSIAEYYSESEVNIIELAKENKIMAVVVYRSIHDCGIADAKAAVEKMLEEKHNDS